MHYNSSNKIEFFSKITKISIGWTYWSFWSNVSTSSILGRRTTIHRWCQRDSCITLITRADPSASLWSYIRQRQNTTKYPLYGSLKEDFSSMLPKLLSSSLLVSTGRWTLKRRTRDTTETIVHQLGALCTGQYSRNQIEWQFFCVIMHQLSADDFVFSLFFFRNEICVNTD